MIQVLFLNFRLLSNRQALLASALLPSQRAYRGYRDRGKSLAQTPSSCVMPASPQNGHAGERRGGRNIFQLNRHRKGGYRSPRGRACWAWWTRPLVAVPRLGPAPTPSIRITRCRCAVPPPCPPRPERAEPSRAGRGRTSRAPVVDPRRPRRDRGRVGRAR